MRKLGVLKFIKVKVLSLLFSFLKFMVSRSRWNKERIEKKRNDFTLLYDTIKNENYVNEENRRSLRFPVDYEIEMFADTLEKGEITNNINYMGIQHMGKYLSPIGTDNPHTVYLYEKRNRLCIASILCTNEIYSEWIVACCQTMWHTKSLIFKDVNGNSFPVGKLLECTAEIRYE